MLALASHELHFFILREVCVFRDMFWAYLLRESICSFQSAYKKTMVCILFFSFVT